MLISDVSKMTGYLIPDSVSKPDECAEHCGCDFGSVGHVFLIVAEETCLARGGRGSGA